MGRLHARVRPSILAMLTSHPHIVFARPLRVDAGWAPEREVRPAARRHGAGERSGTVEHGVIGSTQGWRVFGPERSSFRHNSLSRLPDAAGQRCMNGQSTKSGRGQFAKENSPGKLRTSRLLRPSWRQIGSLKTRSEHTERLPEGQS